MRTRWGRPLLAHNDQVYAEENGLMGFARDVVEEMRRSMVRPGPFVCAIGHMEPGRGFAGDVVGQLLDPDDSVRFETIAPGVVITHYRLWDRRGTEVGTFELGQSHTFPGGGSFELRVMFSIEGRRYSPKAFYDSADTVWPPREPAWVPSADELAVLEDRLVRGEPRPEPAPPVPSFPNARPMAPVRPKELEG